MKIWKVRQTSGRRCWIVIFTHCYLQATGNPLMTTILDAVSDVYQEWIDIVISRAGADEKAKLHGYHRGIVDGISAGDMEGTVRCVDGHYDLIEKLLEI